MDLPQYPEPIVRTRSTTVTLPLAGKDLIVAKAMIEHIKASQEEGSTLRAGIGIAAIQFGYAKRMFYINIPADEEGAKNFEEFLVNPRLYKMTGKAALARGEGCLSVPEEAPLQKGLVHRAAEISIKGYSWLQGKEVDYTVSGLQAIVFQHEYDHLNGKLFFDRINHDQPNEALKDEVLI